jgi:5-methyltetrahydrofolate--homocysteine methyltransferase
MMASLNFIKESVYKGKIKDAEKYTKEEIDRGTLWTDILHKAMLPALDKVGDEYSRGKAYLPEMIASGQAMSKAMEVIKKNIGNIEIRYRGTIILGTVFGDVHDIGKNIVKLNLEGAGFKVFDLGIDAKPDTFISACKQHNADIVGLSCLLSTTMKNLQIIVQALNDSKVDSKIIVGGNPVTEEFAKKIGAHGYADDGYLAVKKAQELLGI